MEKALGPDHTLTLDTVNKLANLFCDQGRLPDMIKFVCIWRRKCINLFGALGRLLLRNSDDSNAQVAFQHELIPHNGGTRVFANIGCDRCGSSITYKTRRSVCRRCPEIDLCQECLIEHQTGIRAISTCLDHSFLEIASEGLIDMQQSTTALETQTASWLRDLMIRYPTKHLRGDES